MNQEDIIRMMQGQMGGGQQQSWLERQPTTKELDTFIERCKNELGYTEHSLFDTIKFRLEQGVHSPIEGEILPMVLQRITGEKQ